MDAFTHVALPVTRAVEEEEVCAGVELRLVLAVLDVVQ